MAKAIHSMIRVQDESRSVAFYREAFGLEVAQRVEFDTFTLVYLANGYGHLAFSVEDIDAEHARFEKAGFAPRKLVDFNHDGKPFARFFFVKDPDGYDIEVLQRAGRFQ